MKLFIFVLLGIFVAINAQTTMDQFVEFQHRFGKFYQNQDEFNMRYAVFVNNLQIAKKLNATSSANFGVTKFMDMTPTEFSNTVLMKKTSFPSKKTGPLSPKTSVALPTSFDWRSQGNVVTPVYNQGQCGSCWAFSTTESIESVWALSGKTLTSFSMQQIVDCDTNDDGCNGGNPPTAYQYVIGAGGIETLYAYPYTAQDGTCAFNSADIAGTISSWTYVTQNSDETQMQNYLVATAPLSVCVDASTWQYYTGGIISTNSGCGNSLDHCVMITGYANDPTSGMNFWWVRNSWGTDWGENGYLQVELGYDVCGIADEVTSAIV